MTITNRDDVIDSRDVISALADLEPWKVVRNGLYDASGNYLGDEGISSFATEEEAGQFMADEDYDPVKVRVILDEDAAEELESLNNLADQASAVSPDWEYGETLVRADYFEEYARQFAQDIGADIKDSWPQRHIDWEAAAEELAQDYAEVKFGNAVYLIREG